MKRGVKAAGRPELRQKLPEEVAGTLLGVIRRQFVPEATDKEWFRDHCQFVRRNVVLWPASFMVGKGFTVPAARYEEILLGVFQEIKRHGQTGEVRYWPGYLMRCVQEHFKHQWEEYYEEAKGLRAQAEAAVLACRARQGDAGGAAVEALAAAHRVLRRAAKRPARSVKAQGEFAL